MKKITCNVIQDLLPLYVDEALSDDAKALVEEHLSDCESCRAKANKMIGDAGIPVSSKMLSVEKEFIKKAKRKALAKKISVAAASAVIAGGLLFAAFFAAVTVKIPVKYDDKSISITADGNELYINYDGTYDGHIGYGFDDAIIDGEKKKVWVVEIYNTFWSKYIEPLYDKKADSAHEIWFETSDECDMIYYSSDIADLAKKMEINTADEVQQYLEDYDLIWEK